MKIQKTASTFVLFYLVIAGLAYFFQTKLFFSPDVGYLLHAANVMLAGGQYGTDILETNPPLIMYLYFPVCLLAKMTTFNLMLSLRLYVLLLAFISSSLSFYLLDKLIRPHDRFLRNFLICILLVVFLFLPIIELGQREHLTTILITPYLFLVAAKLEKKIIPTRIVLLIGCMAGLGFAIKPFFLVTLGLIELYVMWKRRNLLAWVRSETIVILSIFLIYFASIWIYQPGYFKTILPLVIHFYFPGAKESWDLFFSRYSVIFCCSAIFSYLMFYKDDHYRTLNTTLWLALVGMTVAFFIPRSSWFYHTLPALSFAILLFGNYLGQMMRSWKSILHNSAVFLALLGIIYFTPIYYCYSYYQHAKNEWYNSLDELVGFIKAQPGKQTIYCFSAIGTMDCFPLIDLTRSEFKGRYPFFWWFQSLKGTDTSSATLMSEKKFLIDSVSEDLDHYQPKWIIINTQYDQWKKMHATFTAEDSKFQLAWQHYRYVRTIGYYQIFYRAS